MIYLRPYETKVVPAVLMAEWRAPSLAMPKDQFGNDVVTTRFRITMERNKVPVWTGWFESRDDWDVFLWAIATGSIRWDRNLWSYATPAWAPEICEGEDLIPQFAVVTFLTTAGSLQTYNTPADWSTTNNKIECIGAGGSGAAIIRTGGSSTGYACGGGAGGYGYFTNLNATGALSYQNGSAGAAVTLTTTGATAGNPGGDTWFNGASFAAASVGGNGGTGGGVLNSTTAANTNGGTGGSFKGTSGYAGGRGGNISSTCGFNREATGGGGAAGLNGAGNNGGDLSAVGAGTSAGGSGDAGNGGAAGTAGGATGGAGGDGTEYSSSPVYGSGGGGGGGQAPAAATGGAGGLYGGAGGGASGFGANTITSGAGKNGLTVVTYTPATSTVWTNSPMMGM